MIAKHDENRRSPFARVQARRARTIERDVCGIRKRLVDMVPPERRPRVCAPPQFFLAAITINWQTYWLGFASSRRLVATTAIAGASGLCSLVHGKKGLPR